jgi:hypothetical protein
MHPALLSIDPNKMKTETMNGGSSTRASRSRTSDYELVQIILWALIPFEYEAFIIIFHIRQVLNLGFKVHREIYYFTSAAIIYTVNAHTLLVAAAQFVRRWQRAEQASIVCYFPFISLCIFFC